MHEGNGRPDFTADRLERLIAIERDHFWFRGRRQLLLRLLQEYDVQPGHTVADIGAGGGFLCRQLAAAGYRMVAVDFLPAALRRLRADAPEVRVVQSSAETVALADATMDAILALDVLEHIEDSAAARDWERILRPGGFLFVTVPAFPWLWSYRDTAAGHKRRYMREGLEKVLRTAGLTVERSGFYNCLLFPLAAATRILGRESKAVRDREDMPPPLLNRIFGVVNIFEAQGARMISWPWGSSLYAVARKQR